MPPYPLTNFEKQSYYQKEAKPNGIYSRKSSPKIKNGTYIKHWWVKDNRNLLDSVICE